MKRSFSKQWLPISAQLQKLKDAGLLIENTVEAEHFLRHLNYYRFSGYSLAFEKSRHQFIPGTSFEEIRKAYEFDRSLRDLVYESMEVIELDIRTSVAYSFGEKYGPFGHIRSENFFCSNALSSKFSKKAFNHSKWYYGLCKETKRSSEKFVEHFKNNYVEFPDLPIWVVTETMSFGTLSRMIEGMKKSDIKKISSHYKFQAFDFVSCLHHLTYIRNICAHHARLWDREWSIKADLPAGNIWSPPLLPDNKHLFSSLLLQRKILENCLAEKDFMTSWLKRVEQLIETHTPSCPNALLKMGLTPNWKKHPLWNI